MDVLLIGGSTRPASHTGTVLREMAARLERHSAIARVWDVHDHRLPPADPAYSGRARHHPSTDVRRLGQLAREADAFGIVSPVYHNSFSGAVKNTLDFLSVADFRGKPVALGSHGSPRSAVQGCDHLRLVIRGLHGVATVSQLASTDDDFTWTGQGYELTHPAVVQRLDDVMDELLLLAHLLLLGRNRSLIESLAATTSTAGSARSTKTDAMESVIRAETSTTSDDRERRRSTPTRRAKNHVPLPARPQGPIITERSEVPE